MLARDGTISEAKDPKSRSPFLHKLYKNRYIFHKGSLCTSQSPSGWDVVTPLWHKERWVTDKSSIQIKAVSEPEGKGHSLQKEDWIEYIPKCILVKSLDGGHLRENNKSFWSVQLKGTPLLEAIMPLVGVCSIHIGLEIQLFCITCSGLLAIQKKNLCGDDDEMGGKYIHMREVTPTWIPLT